MLQCNNIYFVLPFMTACIFIFLALYLLTLISFINVFNHTSSMAPWMALSVCEFTTLVHTEISQQNINSYWMHRREYESTGKITGYQGNKIFH